MARPEVSGLRAVDSVDAIRLADVGGAHDALAVGMTGLTSLPEQMGVRRHTRAGKRWWPARLIHWLGFEVDARQGVVRMGNRKVEEGLRLR